MGEIVTALVPGRILLINIRPTEGFVPRCHRGKTGSMKPSYLGEAHPWVKKPQQNTSTNVAFPSPSVSGTRIPQYPQDTAVSQAVLAQRVTARAPVLAGTAR